MVETRFEQHFQEAAPPKKRKMKPWVSVVAAILVLGLCVGLVFVILQLNNDNRGSIKTAARSAFGDGFDAQIEISNNGDNDMRDDIFAHFGLTQSSYEQNIKGQLSAKGKISFDGTMQIGERESEISVEADETNTIAQIKKYSELLDLRAADTSEDCEGGVACENAISYFSNGNSSAAVAAAKKAAGLVDGKWINVTAVDSNRSLIELYLALKGKSAEILSSDKLEFVAKDGAVNIRILDGEEDNFYGSFDEKLAEVLRETGIFEGDGVEVIVNKRTRKFKEIKFVFNDNLYEINFENGRKVENIPSGVKDISKIKNEAVEVLKKSDFAIFGDVLESYYADNFAESDAVEEVTREKMQKYLGALDDFIENEGNDPWVEYNATNDYFVTQYIDESASFDEDGKIVECNSIMQNPDGKCLDFVATWGTNIVASYLREQRVYVYKNSVCGGDNIMQSDGKYAMILTVNNMEICEND